MTQAGHDNLAGAIIGALMRRKGGPFLEGDGAALSAGEFLARVGVRQAALYRQGIDRGSRVVVRAGRGLEYWVDLVALWSLGAVTVPLDHAAPRSYEEAILEKARPDGFLDRSALVSADSQGKSATGANGPDIAATAAGDTAAILFTSGSTGAPKGVVLSHGALVKNALSTLAVLDLRADDRLLVATPFHFTSAICHFLAAALSPAVLVAVEGKLFKGDIFDRLREARATCFGGSPMQLLWIGECAESAPPGLRWLMSSGDHLSVATIRLLRRTMPAADIYTFYGLTEVGGRLCALPPGLIDEAAGSVGTPIPDMALSIRDDSGRPVPPTRTGEVYASGPCLFDGYFGDPAATAESLTPHGFRTGDLGFLDQQGMLRLQGRVDDVFKCAGQKVSGVSIAELLMTLDIFADVAVVPKEHPAFGHVPVVLFVLRNGARFDRKAVMTAVRRALPATHMPKDFVEVAAIPRSGSGKVIRREAMNMCGLKEGAA